MPDLLDALRRHLVSATRSSRTIHAYLTIATAFLAIVGLREPVRTDVETFLARSRVDGGRRAAAGRNQELAGLRSLAAVAVREKFWCASPTEGVPFVREAPHDPVVLGAEELRDLFRTAAEAPPADERAQLLAILGLLSQTGLRVHELVALDLGQVDLVTATLLGVRGKGDTVHDLPLNVPAVALLTAWMEERATRAPPDETALFVSSRRTRLSVRTIENWIVALRERAGLAKKVTPHTFRHTAATLALTMGTDLATVAELLRHSDLNTTRRYLHLVDIRRREAVRRLAVTVPAELLGPKIRAPSEASPPAPARSPSSPPPAFDAVAMATNVITSTPTNDTLPLPLEAPTSLGHAELDGQHGLSAGRPFCPRSRCS